MTVFSAAVKHILPLCLLSAGFGIIAGGCASHSAPKPVSAAKFKQKHVDKTLQPHQKVGPKYKIKGKSYKPKHEPRYDEKGIASWYGPRFHGKPTATGERFNMYDMTAAHPTLPLNSLLHVTNLENGKRLSCG